MDVEAFKYPLIRSWRHALKLPPADRVDATKITLAIGTSCSMTLEKATLMGCNTLPVFKINKLSNILQVQ